MYLLRLYNRKPRYETVGRIGTPKQRGKFVTNAQITLNNAQIIK